LPARSPPPSQSAPSIRDVTRQTGITFVHTDGSSGRRYIVETVASGLALLDYDGDGDEDIYFLNGAALPGTKFVTPPRDALYRNDRGWKFTDVTEPAGLGDTGHGLGVTAGDYDSDGDLDLYLNNFGPNVLYRNNGDGSSPTRPAPRAWRSAVMSAPAPVSWTWMETETWTCSSRTTWPSPSKPIRFPT
jgi:hypothetical protein